MAVLQSNSLTNSESNDRSGYDFVKKWVLGVFTDAMHFCQMMIIFKSRSSGEWFCQLSHICGSFFTIAAFSGKWKSSNVNLTEILKVVNLCGLIIRL